MKLKTDITNFGSAPDFWGTALRRSYVPDYFGQIGTTADRAIVNRGTQIGGNSGIVIDPSCYYQLKKIQIESDRPAIINVKIAQTFGVNEELTSGSTAVNLRKTGFNGMPISVGKLQQQVEIDAGFLLYDCGSVTLTAFAAEDGQEKPYVTWRMIGGPGYCGDLEFDAPNRILLISDSIGHSNLGNMTDGRPYQGCWLYVNQVADKIRDLGYRVHVDNQGFGGSTSRNTYETLRSGKYDGYNSGLWIVSNGTNDCVNQQVSIASMKSNLLEIIKRRNRYSPGSDIIFCSPFPTDHSARVAYIANYRTAIQEVANDATYGGNARGVYFSDTSNVFALNAVATADTNFKDIERIAGQRLHLSGLGHTYVANKVFETVQTTNWFTKLR